MKLSSRAKFVIVVPSLGRSRLEATQTATPMVLKDIARVGKFRLSDGRRIEFTKPDLQRMVHTFYRCKRNKVQIPWIDEHEGGAKDAIGYVQDLFVRGERLYARLSVETAGNEIRFGKKAGETSNFKVSIEVTPDFVDGEGRQYKYALTHVANVLHPVIADQRPGLRLGLKTKKVIRMAEENKDAAPEGEGGDSATSLEVSKVVEMLNEYYQAGLPDGISTVKELELCLQVGNNSTEAEAEEITEPPPGEEVPLGIEQPAMMGLKGENARLKAENKALQLSLSTRAEQSFTSELDGLCEAGKISPADREEILETARKSKWQFSLKPYHKLTPVVDTKVQLGLKPNGKAPSVNGVDSESVQKAAEASKASFRRLMHLSN